jgi:hypothetical protein
VTAGSPPAPGGAAARRDGEGARRLVLATCLATIAASALVTGVSLRRRPALSPPSVPPAAADEVPPAQIVAGIDAGFYRQPARTAWGQDAAARVAEVLSRRPAVGTTVAGIDCRQTMCRIEARHPDLAAYRSFVMALMRGRSQPDGVWNGAVNSQAVSMAPGAVRTVTFLAREGTPVPGAGD